MLETKRLVAMACNLIFLLCFFTANIIITNCNTDRNTNPISSCYAPVKCSCDLYNRSDIAKASVTWMDDEYRIEIEVLELLRDTKFYGLETGDIIKGIWSGKTICTRDYLKLDVGDTVALFFRLENPIILDDTEENTKTIRVALWDDNYTNLGTEDVPVRIPTEDLISLFDDPKCDERLDEYTSLIPRTPCNDAHEDPGDGDEPDLPPSGSGKSDDD